MSPIDAWVSSARGFRNYRKKCCTQTRTPKSSDLSHIFMHGLNNVFARTAFGRRGGIIWDNYRTAPNTVYLTFLFSGVDDWQHVIIGFRVINCLGIALNKSCHK